MYLRYVALLAHPECIARVLGRFGVRTTHRIKTADNIFVVSYSFQPTYSKAYSVVNQILRNL